jgi:fatty acid desaturase
MSKQSPSRPIIALLEGYSKNKKHPLEFIQWVYIPLLLFGLLGIVWSIPFPHLNFLGKYNGFVNWASFLLAAFIYYYYRLSPLVSYVILLSIFAFSAGIVGLEKLQKVGYPRMEVISLMVFTLGMLILFLGYQRSNQKISIKSFLDELLVGPIWLVQLIFTRWGFKI